MSQSLPFEEAHLQRRPDVKRDLLLHYDVQKASLLFVKDFAARGLDFLLQRAAPLPTICITNTETLTLQNLSQTGSMKGEKNEKSQSLDHTLLL